MSKSQTTTTNPDWLPIPHAGDVLVSEFIEANGLDCAAVAGAIAIDAAQLQKVIDGQQRIDGELDLRLSRYFGMSEGFFLRLQASAELRVAKRNLNGELEQITPRAA